MCGSKRPAQTTTTTAPPPEVMEAYRNVMARANTLADTPYQQYTGDRIAGFTPDQFQAFQGVRDAQGVYQPFLDQAQQYATAGASPIDASAIEHYQNPFQQQVIDATMADFNTQNARQLSEVRGNAAARGALGGNRVAVAEALAGEQQNRTQAPIIANLHSQGWNSALGAAQADRGAAGQAAYTFGNLGNQAFNSSLTGANALYGMGGQQQALAQAGLNVPYQYFQEQRAYPFQTTSWLSQIASGLGANMGGTSTTSQPPPNMWNSVIGAGATLGGAYMMSDERAKDNIIPIGEMFDGTPLYRYNYKGSDKTEIGVMAQDVERRDPGAVAVGSDGYRRVDYDRATAPSAMRGEYASGGAVETPGSGFMRGYGDGNGLGGGLITLMGDPGELKDNPFAWGLGGMAYKAIRGKAEGGAVGVPGIATGSGVLPYSSGFIPVLPMGRGSGPPRVAAPAPPHEENAADNALRNLSNMYRNRRPGSQETLDGWDAAVSPDAGTLGDAAIMGFADGGNVDPPYVMPESYDFLNQNPLDYFGAGGGDMSAEPPQFNPPGASFHRPPGATPQIPPEFMQGASAAIAGEQPVAPRPRPATLGDMPLFERPQIPALAGDLSMDDPRRLGAPQYEFSGPAVNRPTLGSGFAGQVNPTNAPIHVVAPAGGGGAPAVQPNPAGAPLAMANTSAQRGVGRNPGADEQPSGGSQVMSGGQSSSDPSMRNIGLALMMAGLRTMSSRSPYLGVAVGEGGQTGIQTYMQQEDAQHRRRLSQQQIDLQARRLEEQARHNRANEGANRFQIMSAADGNSAVVFNTRTGETDQRPVQIAQRGANAANRTELWQTRRDAWLQVHPGDQEGALRYAAGHRDNSLSPQNAQRIALQMAQRDAQADLSLTGDTRSRYIQNRAAEIYQQLQAPGQPAPAPPSAPQQQSSGGSWWNPLSWGGGPAPNQAQGQQPQQGSPSPAPAPSASGAPPAPSAIAGQIGPGRWGWSPSARQWVNSQTGQRLDANGNPVR